MFQKLEELGKALVIGRRTNVEYNNERLYHPSDVTEIAKQNGTLHVIKGIDYFFIAKNAFPWHRIPDFVIARNGYDNFLVATAIKNNISVIDATKTLLAVHQTDVDGNRAGSNTMIEQSINRDLIRKLINTDLREYLPNGFTVAAPYETIYTGSNSDGAMTVRVIKRTPLIYIDKPKHKKTNNTRMCGIAQLDSRRRGAVLMLW